MASVCYTIDYITVVTLPVASLAVQHTEQLKLDRDLNKLLQHLWPARSRWRYIGTALGLDIGTLDAIQGSNQYKCDPSFYDMLREWLKWPNTGSPRPSWSGLIDAMNAPSVRIKLLESKGNYMYVYK